jgi:hypothetical protein
MAPEIIAKKFAQKGWTIRHRGGGDICPECDAKGKSSMKVIQMPAPIGGAANNVETPNVMTKDDRRVIFAKLQDVYLDEARGYDADWGDQKVADDLKVPVAWVCTIRDENFGPEGVSPEVHGLLKQGQECSLAIRKMEDQIASLQESIESNRREIAKIKSELQPLIRHAERVEKHFERITKTLRI